MDFKKINSLEVRKKMSSDLLSAHPGRVPIIISPKFENIDLQLDRQKFLVPDDLTMGKFIYQVRQEIKNLNSNQSLFFLVDNIIPPVHAPISLIYEKYKDPLDNFLYLEFTTENTFG